MPVGAGDITGDGSVDALVTGLDRRTLEVHPGRGDGTFAPRVAVDLGGEVHAFHVADLDRDGRGDIVASSFASLAVLWGRAGERFIAGPAGVGGFPLARALAVGDLDRDGLADLAVPSTRGSEVWVFPSPASLSPRAPEVLALSRLLTTVECTDLDGDGALDLAGADPVDRLLTVLLDAAGGVRRESALAACLLPAAVALGRMDGDGAADLVVPCAASSELAVLLAAGGGAFSEARRTGTVSGPRGAAIEDIDRDGAATRTATGR
ncbi:MAG: VCBS repeat-containing protein [Planctomycetes bacterium]|nr:VCBS repeat-containing protein [Planctomycetota bacterium]